MDSTRRGNMLSVDGEDGSTQSSSSQPKLRSILHGSDSDTDNDDFKPRVIKKRVKRARPLVIESDTESQCSVASDKTVELERNNTVKGIPERKPCKVVFSRDEVEAWKAKQGNPSFKCDRCDQTFSLRETLAQHQKNFHGILSDDKAGTSSAATNAQAASTSKGSTKNFSCTMKDCTFSSATVIDMQLHAINEHAREIYPCTLCPTTLFWQRQDLLIHNRKYHFGDKICPFCSAPGGSSSDIGYHFDKYHRGECGYVENVSPKEVPKQVDLKAKLADFGFDIASGTTIQRENYLVNHDDQKLVWGFERLTRASVNNKIISYSDSKKDRLFRPDPAVPHPTASSWGINKVGFQCGHVSPAANNLHSLKAFNECMMLGNVVPQHSLFNVGLWQQIDAHCRKLTNYWDEVYALTILIYNDDHKVLQTIDGCDIHVADQFIKVVFMSRSDIDEPLMQIFRVDHLQHFKKTNIFSKMIGKGEVETILSQIGLTKIFKSPAEWFGGQQIFKCFFANCHKVFQLEKSCENHQSVHKPMVKCKSVSCIRRFATNEEMESHMTEAHPKIACEMCDKVYYSEREYDLHIRSHLYESPYKCTYCKTSYSKKSNLNKHLYKYHGIPKTGHKNWIVGTTMPISNTLRTFRCIRCSFTTTSVVTITQHKLICNVQQVHKQSIYKCNKCEKTFKTVLSHKNHICDGSQTQNLKFKCTACSRCFPNTSDMTKHMARIHPEIFRSLAKFKCEVCGRDFITLSGRIRHLGRVHQGNNSVNCKDKSRICSVCKKAYSSANALRLHIKWTHDETYIRPQCTICKKKFRQKGSLDRHVKIFHTGKM